MQGIIPELTSKILENQAKQAVTPQAVNDNKVTFHWVFYTIIMSVIFLISFLAVVVEYFHKNEETEETNDQYNELAGQEED